MTNEEIERATQTLLSQIDAVFGTAIRQSAEGRNAAIAEAKAIVADDIREELRSLLARANEEAAREAEDFDEWVWCKCSECKVDAHSHAVETHASMQALAGEIRALCGSLQPIATPDLTPRSLNSSTPQMPPDEA